MPNTGFTTGFRGGILEVFARIGLLPGKQGVQSHFVDEVKAVINKGILLSNDTIGEWYATMRALDVDTECACPGVAVRFLISRTRHDAEEGDQLFETHKVVRDMAQPSTVNDDFELLFTFTNIAPVSVVVEYFKEFATNEIKRLRFSSKAS